MLHMTMRNQDNHTARRALPSAAGFAAITLAAASVMCVQIISPGYYYKIIEHAVMAQRYVPRFVESFSLGVYYPGWMGGDFNGYGSPIFVFYSPVFYLLSAILSTAGLPVTLSASFVDLAFLITGGAGVYVLLSETHGERAGLFGAFFYMLLPSRVLDLYYANTPAGRLALAWLPFVLHFARACAGPKPGRAPLAGMASSYTALILTHLATAYIFTPFVLAYALAVSRGGNSWRGLARVIAGLAAGIGLSSFFFLPVLLLRGEVHIGLMTLMEDYSPARNFMFGPGPGSRIQDMAALISVQAATTAAEAAGIGLIYFLARRYAGLKPCRDISFSLWAVVACLFLMSSMSLFVWDFVPGLRTWSFPYRLATILILFVSLVAGAAVSRLSKVSRTAGASRVFMVIIVLVLTADSAALIVKSTPMTDKQLSDIGGRVDFVEYLPVSVDPAVLPEIRADDPPLSSDADFSYEVDSWADRERSFSISSGKGALVRVRTFWFPGWRAWVDGSEVPLGVEDKTGAMLIDVPAGKHEVRLRFTNTRPRTAGLLISLITSVMLVFPYRPVRTSQRPA